MSSEKFTKKGMFATMVLGALISSFMATVMSTVLPSIMISFDVPASQAQMVTSLYSLVSGIVVIATAIIIKNVPTRKLFLISMCVFTFGILLCAVAQSFGMLLLGRIIQGIGYGVLVSLTQVVILTIVPLEKRGFAMGIYALAVIFAPVLGPIVAGVIIDNASWHLIFWIVFVVCLITLGLALLFIENVLENSRQRLDTPSMVLAAIGFTGFVLAGGNFGSYRFFSVQVGLVLVIGIISLIIFSLRQFKLSQPLLNLRVFKNRDFTVSVIINIILHALMNATATIMPIMIQTILGKSATSFGIVVAPCALFIAGLSPFTGKLYDKIGLRKLAIVGSIIILISNGAILMINENVHLGLLMGIMALLGIGMSTMQMNIFTYGMEKLEGEAKTDGTAIQVCLRTMGSAMGTAVFVAIMSMGVLDGRYTMADIHRSYLVLTITVAVVLVMSLLFIRNRVRKPEA